MVKQIISQIISQKSSKNNTKRTDMGYFVVKVHFSEMASENRFSLNEYILLYLVANGDFHDAAELQKTVNPTPLGFLIRFTPSVIHYING